ALSIHLLIRYVLGLREEEAGMLTVAPMFPQALRQVGAVYHVQPIQWGNYVLDIECTVRDAQSYTVRLRSTKQVKEEITEAIEEKVLPQAAGVNEYVWEGRWGE